MSTQIDSPYYFISYSRQEVTFVDSFSRELEKSGILNWVDFRSLIPGKPWQVQLDDGVHNAAAILLVVSKASMSSGPVKDEWAKSLVADRRIILIAFEPCEVPPSLAGLEWVDFTTDFEKGISDLKFLLSQPRQKPTSAPPSSGLILPSAVKQFQRASRWAAFFSILGVALNFQITLFTYVTPILENPDNPIDPSSAQANIAAILIISMLFLWFPAFLNFRKIPKQVENRTHDAEKIKNAVNGLLYAGLALLVFIASSILGVWENYTYPAAAMAAEDARNLGIPLMLFIFATCAWLYRAMISDGMYRWAGPKGVIVRAKRPDLSGHLDNGPSLKIGIEFAPQDRNYAEELKTAIVKAGHTCIDNLQEADVVLPLISAFKSGSVCDPQKQRVLPILLQLCDVDSALSKVQWVDLRYGKASIDAVANLLDEPDEFLRVLGILPIRTTILPEGVRRVVGALTVALPFSVLMALNTLLKPSYDFSSVVTIATMAGIYLLRRNLINRKFWMNKSRLKIFYAFGAKKRVLSGIVRLLEKIPKLLEIEKTLNRQLGKINFSYPWLLAGSVLIAIMAVNSYWGIDYVGYLMWIIPLLTLSKEARMWLPVSAK